MAGKMPQGLVGMLQGKNFVKPPAKKKASANKDAIKRRLASKAPMGPSDNDADDYPMK